MLKGAFHRDPKGCLWCRYKTEGTSKHWYLTTWDENTLFVYLLVCLIIHINKLKCKSARQKAILDGFTLPKQPPKSNSVVSVFQTNWFKCCTTKSTGKSVSS